MPGKKPSSLITRKTSKGDRAARVNLEASVKPMTELTTDIPSELKGKKIACLMWVKIITLQLETQAAQAGAALISPFDENTLITLCKAKQEEKTLELKLEKLDQAQEDLYLKVKKIKPTADNLRDYVALWGQFNATTANYKNFSARLDSHRNSMLELSRVLYLTPASRSGVSIQKKELPEPMSEMEKVLNGL